MKQRSTRTRTAVTVLLAVGLVGLGAIAAEAVDVRPGGKRIHLTGQTIASTADPEAGHSMGDLIVFTDDLFDDNGEPAGQVGSAGRGHE